MKVKAAVPDAIVLIPKLLTFHWRKIADDRRGRHCTLLIAGIAHTACTFFAEIEELRRRSVESAESTHIDWFFFSHMCWVCITYEFWIWNRGKKLDEWSQGSPVHLYLPSLRIKGGLWTCPWERNSPPLFRKKTSRLDTGWDDGNRGISIIDSWKKGEMARQ